MPRHILPSSSPPPPPLDTRSPPPRSRSKENARNGVVPKTHPGARYVDGKWMPPQPPVGPGPTVYDVSWDEEDMKQRAQAVADSRRNQGPAWFEERRTWPEKCGPRLEERTACFEGGRARYKEEGNGREGRGKRVAGEVDDAVDEPRSGARRRHQCQLRPVSMECEFGGREVIRFGQCDTTNGLDFVPCLSPSVRCALQPK